ncbi:unnamed protein product [Owenia fusiformis]|nr:unnamed protein product [Owenia fusiformis]
MLLLNDDWIVAATGDKLMVYGVLRGSDDIPECRIKRLKRLTATEHRDSIHCIIHVSEHTFASGSIDGSIVLWCSKTLAPFRFFMQPFSHNVVGNEGEKHDFPLSIQHMIAFQHVQQRFLLTTLGNGFCIYDVETGKMLAENKQAHNSKILYVCLVKNNSVLATCSEDGRLMLWGCIREQADVLDDNIFNRLLGTSQVDFPKSCDSKRVLKLKHIGECKGHSGAIQMCVNNGNNGLISCGSDGLVMAWSNAAQDAMSLNRLIQGIVFGTR